MINKISIPGDGGWDVLTIDAAARRLYVSHSTQVEIIDIDQNKLVGQILDTPGVHDIALAPEFGRGFTSNGKEDKVSVFDLKSNKILNKVDVGGKNPDILIYDLASRRIVAFNGKTSDATVIDAATEKVVGRIPLGGKPEFAVSDGSGTIFVNLEDKSALESFDSKTLEVKATWPLAPCEEPSALAIDSQNGRLFAGCGNKIMVVVDATSGHVITSLSIGDHVDGGVFNSATAEIFFSNGDGTLTVIHEDSPDTYHITDNVKTQRGARTLALDAKTNRLFSPTAQFGPPPAATADKPHPRPAILPGTFTILVVGPS
jgi:DNA-binding beta-propeller fold protein YncE